MEICTTKDRVEGLGDNIMHLAVGTVIVLFVAIVSDINTRGCNRIDGCDWFNNWHMDYPYEIYAFSEGRDCNTPILIWLN